MNFLNVDLGLVFFFNVLFMYQFPHNPVAFDNFFQSISTKHQHKTRLLLDQLTILTQLELITGNSAFVSKQ